MPTASTKRELFTIAKQRHGAASLKFGWHPEGTMIATAGQNNVVCVWDRSGVEVASLALKTPCRAIDWDPVDGEFLAVLQEGSQAVMLWDSHTRKAATIDSGTKEPITACKWSRNGATLALVSAGGGVVFFSKRTQKKKQVATPLSSPATHCTWSGDNLLAIATEDHEVVVINEEGDTVMSTAIKGAVRGMQFSAMKLDRDAESKYRENTLSFIVGDQTVYLFSLDDPGNPVELAFQKKYGSIAEHTWFGDGYMMLGFSGGFFVVISTSMDEIGQELYSGKIFAGPVTSIIYNPTTKRVAACGDVTVKLFDPGNWKSSVEVAALPKDRGLAETLSWTRDGQILSVGTSKGYLSSFLTKMTVLNATCGSSMAFMSSLRTVSVSDLSAVRPTATELDTAVEPTFLALGPAHAVVGLNNTAWFYATKAPRSAPVVTERKYPGSVDSMSLNSKWAAALYEGKAMLHPIDSAAAASSSSSAAAAAAAPSATAAAGKEQEIVRLFPEKDDDIITDVSVTADFFIYGTAKGSISFFYIPDFNTVVDYRHSEVSKGIKWLFPNALGTRLVFVDSAGHGFLYNPVTDTTLTIPDWTESVTGVMWDRADTSVFVTAAPDALRTYTYVPVTLDGPQVALVCKTAKPATVSPLLSYNGTVTCQDSTGALTHLVLQSHTALTTTSSGAASGDRRKQQFAQALKLNRIREAWSVAQKLNSSDCWAALGKEALAQLDIPLAIIAYRQLGDAGMVDALEQCASVEDMNLLAGQVNLLWGNYDQAQKLFLSSSEPLRALWMRRDLMHWEQALQLAKSLAPQELPMLSAETAQQLEFKGDHQGALDMYQAGLAGAPEATEQQQRCAAGVARMTIRVGDVSKGITLAMASKNPAVLRDCAIILESLKQFAEAAQLYAQAGMHDKAALIYIKTRQSSQLKEVMPKVTIPSIHAQYARAKEEEGDFAEAERSYLAARDTDSVIRLVLRTSKSPERAFALVREMRSQDGARMAAEYCQKVGDFRSAIEFLLMATLFDDAFAVAQQHEAMDKFAEIIGEGGTPEQYARIAEHYENRGDFPEAGKFFSKCQQYAKALKLFLRSGEGSVLAAIEVVGKARDDNLTRALVDYLMGDLDGVPKDPNFIFRLYMALGNYLQAARTALIISRQEQELGNYKVAHAILFDTFRVLDTHNIKIISELRRSLYLLHAYILAKLLIKSKQHELSARLIVRVARNISKFPSHTVPILTTAAIETYRVGLKKTAFEFASQLVAPEYRKDIPANYKRPIEQIVRKMERTQDKEEDATPCPSCGAPLFQSELDCPQCKNFLPWCVITGRHMVLDDWSCCPNCSFPALFSQIVPYAASKMPCPMCDEAIDPAKIRKEADPLPLLKKAIESVDITQLDQQQSPPATK